MTTSQSNTSTRTVTELDNARLFLLAQRRPALGQRPGGNLLDVIDSADLVPSQNIEPDVVTMQSVVVIEDLETGRKSELALSYPDDADATAGRLSVFSPVGTSLLGLRVGDIARWTLPDGREGAARIVEVLFQPEKSGDYLA